MGVAYQKALLLYRQKRYDLAREELSRELAQEPNSGYAHALLALCMEGQNQPWPARETAERAISLAPQLPFAHYALAWILYRDVKYLSRPRPLLATSDVQLRRRCLNDAEASVREAIRLSTGEPSHFGLLSLIRFDLQDPQGALDAARRGLAIDPKEGQCLRMQAIALRAVADAEHAAAASAHALSANPQGAAEHVIHGRALILAGQYDRAFEHFAEGLRIDPNFAAARDGYLEGLRARYTAYRVLLRLGLGNTRPRWVRRHGVLLVIVALLAIAVPPAWIDNLQQHHRLDKDLAGPLIGLSVLPGLYLPTGKFFFDFLIQFHPLGRQLQSDRERKRGRLTVGSFLVLFGIFGYGVLNALGYVRIAPVLPLVTVTLFCAIVIKLIAVRLRYGPIVRTPATRRG